MAEVPEFGLGDDDVLLEVGRFASLDGQGLRVALFDGFAGGAEHGDFEGDGAGGVGLVEDARGDVDGGLGGIDLGRGDEEGIGREVDGIGHHHADVAVNARAFVPAGGGLLGVIGAHGEDVDFPPNFRWPVSS